MQNTLLNWNVPAKNPKKESKSPKFLEISPEKLFQVLTKLHIFSKWLFHKNPFKTYHQKNYFAQKYIHPLIKHFVIIFFTLRRWQTLHTSNTTSPFSTSLHPNQLTNPILTKKYIHTQHTTLHLHNYFAFFFTKKSSHYLNHYKHTQVYILAWEKSHFQCISWPLLPLKLP